MAQTTYIKDPNDVLDYTFDYSVWLQASETVTSHTATVTGATKDSSSNSTTAVTVWVSGGTAGSTASILSRITTNQGRTIDRTISLRIQER